MASTPEATDWGPPLNEYPHNVRDCILEAAAMTIVAIASVSLAITPILIALTYSTAAMFRLLFVGLALVALSIPVWALWRLVKRLRLVRDRVVVYPTGLVYWSGSRSESYRWEDVARVYQSVEHVYYGSFLVRTNYLYTIVLADRRQCRLTNALAGIAELGERIQQEVSGRLLPAALARYQRGETLDFGGFRVSQHGVSAAGGSLHWGEIGAIQVSQGRLRVLRAVQWSRWQAVPVATVPNLPIFLALAQFVGKSIET